MRGLVAQIAGGAIVLGLLMALLFGVLLVTIDVRRDAIEASRDAQAVVTRSGDIQRLVLDAETGTRGYLLTRERRFLQPYTAAARRLPSELAALRSAVEDEPGQRTRAVALSAAAVGLLALPFFVVFELIGAFVEAFGYLALAVSLALGIANVSFALLFMAVAVLSGVLLSLAAVLLEDLAFRRYGRLRELLRLVAYSVGENFGYRQVITGYRLRGVVSYLRGDKAWGEIRRVGFAQAPQLPPGES